MEYMPQIKFDQMNDYYLYGVIILYQVLSLLCYINKSECASVCLCAPKYFDKRVLNGGEYDIGWDYDIQSLNLI